MAIICNYRIQFLFGFFILLLILLICPLRAETSQDYPESIIAQDFKVLQNNTRTGQPYRSAIMNGLHNLSGLNRINDTSFFDILLKYSGIIRSLPSAEPITGYNIEKDKIENYVMDSIQARIHPLVELSYPFSEKIAFEFTGHFTRHEMGTSFAALYRYNYSTELSESVVYFFVSCNFDS